MMRKHRCVAVASWVARVRGYEVRMAEKERLRPQSYYLGPLLHKEGLLSSLRRPLHSGGLSTPTAQHLFTASANVHRRECARSLINHLLSATKGPVWSPLIVCGWKPAPQLTLFTECHMIQVSTVGTRRACKPALVPNTVCKLIFLNSLLLWWGQIKLLLPKCWKLA